MEVNYIEIIKKGKIYNPAFNHYKDHEVNINCNICSKVNIPICYGYKDYDICADCTMELIVENVDQFDPTFLDNLISSLNNSKIPDDLDFIERMKCKRLFMRKMMRNSRVQRMNFQGSRFMRNTIYG
jgi:hypothetical protein